jgi:hypothetical protein
MPPKKKRPTLTKGSQGPLKPIKPTQALKPIKPFQQYETQQSSSASEEARKRTTGRYSPAPRAVKGIIANYRATSQRPSGGNPNPIKRISPARIGKLKQIRMNERSQAFAGAGNRYGTGNLSRAGQMAQRAKTKPVTFTPTERAPSKAPGKYRPVAAAPISPRDYRKDIASFTATENRNKSISDMRERSRLKRAFKQRRTR